jgi:putative transposase
MKRIRHSPEQIIRKLREADAELAKGIAVPEIWKALGIAENTYYRWRNQFGGIKADEMKRLKDLEKESSRLKALVADLSLDKAILKEAVHFVYDRPGRLVSPARRREAVVRAMAAFRISERRACRALGVPRSSQRYVGTEREREEELSLRIRALAREDPRSGYRRIKALLVREGWSVNLKRVHRLWRREGLEVPQIQRRRRRLGQSETGCARRRSERPNHVWS